MANRDFAKIVRASCGIQVLFFVEPAEDVCNLHQVINLNDAQVDIALGFVNSSDADERERRAFTMLDGVGVEHADKLVAYVMKKTGMEAV